MRSLIILTVFSCTLLSVYSQTRSTLNLPTEYQKAYQNLTRSPDGKPGPNYWQNHSDYNLKATVDPDAGTLKGKADIFYHNNSSDFLDSLVFSLGTGIKPGISSGNDESYDNQPSGNLMIESILLNDLLIDIRNTGEFRREGVQAVVILKQPLKPDSTVRVRINWNFMLAKGNGQDKNTDNNSMFFGHWFPEINVYDDIYGWNSVKYNAGGEAYHDFSNFHIEILVPENFMVWASVPPQNQDKIYPDYILQRLSEVNEKGLTFIVTSEDIRKGIKLKSNTWKYAVDNFPDFSFAVSDRFTWAACLYINRDTYFLNAVYPENNRQFSVNLKAVSDALDIFTRTLPDYPFPFKYFTDFNGLKKGGAGFPGMINTAFEDSTKYSGLVSALEANRGLTYHEMIRMYFPFFTGINAGKYGWMNEGWETFTTYLIPQPVGVTDLDRYGRPTLTPMMVAPRIITDESRANASTTAAYSYYSLRELLKDQIFVKCLQEYFSRWQYKHPVPYDFFNTFNAVSGRDLNWYWKKWYFDWGYPDLGIQGCDGKTVKVANMGGRPMAFSLVLYYYDSPKEVKEINPSVWKENYSISIPVNKDKILVKAEIQIPFSGDIISKNNQWKTR